MSSLRGFGFTFDIEAGRTRNWYVDDQGEMRWSEDDELVRPNRQKEPPTVDAARVTARGGEGE